MTRFRIVFITTVFVFTLVSLATLMRLSLAAPNTQEATDLPPFPTATPPLQAFPTATPSPAPDADSLAPVVEMTCHAEPKWSFIINVRRGPSSNWGITRNLVHNVTSPEMRVFGRNEAGDWYHVVLPEPYQTEVGWVLLDTINLYGVCDNLPITDAEPEIPVEAVPPAPQNVPMPEFVRDYITLTENDRAFLIKPGILYIRRQIPGDAKERIQAHILILDVNAPQLQIGVTIGAIPDVRAIPVSQMAKDTGAFAAISGDYYAGNYWPQGITVINGQVVTAPKSRAAFGITKTLEPFIGYFTNGWTWNASVVATNGETIPLQLMNLPCDPVWLCLYSYHRDHQLPANGNNPVRVLLDSEFNVLDIVNNGARVEIPDGHFALAGGSVTGEWLLNNVRIGDQLQINLPTTPPWQEFETVIGGGPRIVWDGAFWQDCDPEQEAPFCEEFSPEFRERHYFNNNIPRAAVGYVDNLVYAIMVEGYEVDDSRGVTQHELAQLFIEFGAVQAMEFDGGGSATMYIRPGLVSDFGFEGERPVSNALLFYWTD